MSTTADIIAAMKSYPKNLPRFHPSELVPGKKYHTDDPAQPRDVIVNMRVVRIEPTSLSQLRSAGTFVGTTLSGRPYDPDVTLKFTREDGTEWVLDWDFKSFFYESE
jgi:hypothetical protein